MKTSIVLSTQPTSFSALAYQGDLEKNIVNIKNLDYDGVELAVCDPALLDTEMLRALLKTYDLPVPAISTGQVFVEEGLSFTHPEKRIRCKSIERIKSLMAFAEQFNAVVIIGLVRGKLSAGISKGQAEQWLIEGLTECASYKKSVRLAIEPINRYETDIINTVHAGLELIRKTDIDTIGLLLDTFHMNIEESVPVESIFAAKDRLFHFHVADSNRWYPGAGHIDFKRIIEVLDQIGYKEFISAEILPLPDPETAAMEVIKNLRALYI
jgi:sugar phosphate isomerase/epimerase